MFGFFAKRPGACALAILSIFATGAVVAHQDGPDQPKQPSLSVERARKPAPPPAKVSWKDQLDLDALKAEGRRMVQVMPDGTRVETTLDADLQAHARKLMARYELPYGAMVMSRVSSGHVLALAGHSSRDRKVDTEALTLTPWAPAASVFKVVTAAALLARGVPADTTVCYHGGLRGLRMSNIVDNPRLDTACRSLSYAVAKSVNPVMAKLTLKYLSSSKLKRWAERFGFNKPIPFSLPVKPSKASIPSDKLELARVSAGFWHTEISAMHGAVIAGVAANGGVLRWPRLVSRVVQPDGAVENGEGLKGRRVLSHQAARKLRQMMVRTTTMGTARKAFKPRRGSAYLGDIKVGGKTGSLSRKDPFLHYSWFVGFAPAKKPEIAFAVLLGNPAKWRIKAHTAARMLLQKYFELKKERAKKQEKLALR